MIRAIHLLLIGGLALSGAVVGCGDNGDVVSQDLAQPGVKDLAIPATGDLATLPDLAPLPPDMGCYGVPNAQSTHYQIINACTNAQSLTKTPVLPLLNPDGGLPPLP